jgi:nucleoside-diphosphate-sugar epimerase
VTDIFIIGCGYVGTLVAQKWRKDNRSVTALARSTVSAGKLQAQGIQTHSGDLDDAVTLQQLPVAGSIVYYFAPPPPSGGIDPRMRHCVVALNPTAPPRQIIYLSTSGVYGDNQGAWVTEETPVNPQADRARRRVDAESTVIGWCEAHRVPLTILRVAGIYGADKLPIKRLQQGSPVLREEECGYTNRIHIEDLVNICVAVAKKGEGSEIYNVSDGHPGTMTGYFNAVADTLGLPRPPAITMEEAQRQLTPAMLSYLTESRRLDNRKLLEKLGITLHYPDLPAGLRGIKAGGQED